MQTNRKKTEPYSNHECLILHNLCSRYMTWYSGVRVDCDGHGKRFYSEVNLQMLLFGWKVAKQTSLTGVSRPVICNLIVTEIYVSEDRPAGTAGIGLQQSKIWNISNVKSFVPVMFALSLIIHLNLKSLWKWDEYIFGLKYLKWWSSVQSLR